MLKGLKIVTIVLLLVAISYFGFAIFKAKMHYIVNLFSSYGSVTSVAYKTCKGISAYEVLKDGNGIMFMETTDRMEPPSLVLCALESAARVYPDRPVVFFMKGLGDITTWEEQYKTRQRFPSLSSFKNIYFFPLRMGELFKHTPLMPWFKRTNPKLEVYWTHVSSDACRFAMMWRYGGLYMDTDVISLRPIRMDNFLAAEHDYQTSSSVFGLAPFHNTTWEFMKNFVENYRGEIWTHQGPGVFTRVVNKTCGMPVFTSMKDVECMNMPYLHPQRFYPLQYEQWHRYFEAWKEMPTFLNCYGLHLWNFMNKKGQTMVPGSKTLVEHLYQRHCPTTYKAEVKKKKS